jgi:Heparinase II/III-like protein
MTGDPGRNSGVQFLGSSVARASGEGLFILPPHATGAELILALIFFDASRYPLESHCRYALHAGGGQAYTFPHFSFKQEPPGIRVGPWPSWRDIPGMPTAHLRAGGKEKRLEFQFWGDERETKTLRAVAQMRLRSGEEVRAVCTDSRLVPVKADFYAIHLQRPAPRKFSISPDMLLRHPRLLLNERDIGLLKGRRSADRDRMHARLRDFKEQWNLPLAITPEAKIPRGPEGLAPEDRLLIGAYLALLDGTSQDVSRGIEALMAYVGLTGRSGFEPLTIDTQSGEVLFLLCVGYDWLFAALGDHESSVRNRLWEVAEVCWRHLGYERDDYAQAHYLGCGLGLVAFSLLFWDAHPRAQEWGMHCAGVLDHVLSLLPPDGYYPHGINLWIYEFGFLLRWLELFRTGAGLDFWPKNDLLVNASAFRASATSPDGLYGVTFGDPQYRVGGDSWCHYLIASRTGSREARSVGDLLQDLPVEGIDFRNAPARRRVYEDLWFPDQVQPGASERAVVNFTDGTQLFVRAAGTLFTFRSGPPMGVHRYREGLAGGYGHSDPCCGSFLYYSGGSMTIAGPGPVYRRDTALHNVITINGQGQIGDSCVWTPDFIPPSSLALPSEVRVDGAFVMVTADVAASYLPHLGVRVVRRSMLIDPGRRIIGIDVVDLSSDHVIEWNIHSWGDFTFLGGKTDLVFKIGTPARLRLHCTVPDDTSRETGLAEFVPAYPNDGVRDRFLRLSHRGRTARFAWCIVSETDGVAEIRAGDKGEAFWRFTDGTLISFDGFRMKRTEGP